MRWSRNINVFQWDFLFRAICFRACAVLLFVCCVLCLASCRAAPEGAESSAVEDNGVFLYYRNSGGFLLAMPKGWVSGGDADGCEGLYTRFMCLKDRRLMMRQRQYM